MKFNLMGLYHPGCWKKAHRNFFRRNSEPLSTRSEHVYLRSYASLFLAVGRAPRTISNHREVHTLRTGFFTFSIGEH